MTAKRSAMKPVAAKPYEQMTEAERDAAALAEADLDADGTVPMVELGAHAIPVIDIKALRRRLGMTQKAFAESFGFTLGALRHWEQRQRLPDRSARILLRVIAEDPERVQRIAREAS